jgi:cyclopropane-fatty-acyl-phospholipid synthase
MTHVARPADESATEAHRKVSPASSAPAQRRSARRGPGGRGPGGGGGPGPTGRPGPSRPAPPATGQHAARLLRAIVGDDPPVRLRLWDGTVIGAPTATEVVVRTPQALRRVLFMPGEVGFARAYVAGEIDVVAADIAADDGPADGPADERVAAAGDIFEALALRDRIGRMPLNPPLARAALGLAWAGGSRPPAPPPEEIRLRGRRHSRRRDAAAISHHYDVGNEFYRLVLGESMTYSCAVWENPGVGLRAAQDAKHDLISVKLGLRPGMRLLDVGCGWGSLLIRAAQRYGVSGVGVTLSTEQATLARARVRDAGLADQIEIRVRDYRDVDDGPFDAISSVGMVEHVGRAKLPLYFADLHRLLRPGGRLLNHGISLPGDPALGAVAPRVGGAPLPRARSFVERFVFPDGELHEIGAMVSVMQAAGFEARHVESLREHYAATLRAWVANLERGWERAVELAGPGRARVWRLYMSGCALGFEAGQIQIHQVLAVRPDGARSGFEARETYPLPGQPR